MDYTEVTSPTLNTDMKIVRHNRFNYDDFVYSSIFRDFWRHARLSVKLSEQAVIYII